MGLAVHILLLVVGIVLGGTAVVVAKRYSHQVARALHWVAAATGRLPVVRRYYLSAIARALKRIPKPHRKRSESGTVPDLYKPIDMAALNCRVRIGREPYDNEWQSILLVDICGTINAPDDNCEVRLEIALTDTAESQPALVRSQQGVAQVGCPFIHQTEMGRLCHRATTLEEWTSVAKICPQSFVLPRQGQQSLQCGLSVLSKATGERLACAACIVAYESAESGYLDIEDGIQRAKTLAVGLAFSVGATDNNLLDSEVDVIYAWVKTNFDSTRASDSARSQLQLALHKTMAFFRHGGRLDIERICREIVETAPMVGRLDILDLCLRVAAARGQVSEGQTALLKKLADSLGIDRARLRAMAEKTLSINLHDVRDSEIVLGVTTGMSKDEARQQLNHEYAKWSSRVISSDPAIQKQADQMLQLIAEARTQFVGAQPTK